MMNLQEFVSNVLTQLMNGIVDAQKQCEQTGALINPIRTLINPDYVIRDASDRPARYGQLIEFDVAVEVVEDAQIKGGAGIFVGAIGLGTQAQTGSQNSTVSRIKFAIPVFLPQQEETSNVGKR